MPADSRAGFASDENDFSDATIILRSAPLRTSSPRKLPD
jgi:hypothetical protein